MYDSIISLTRALIDLFHFIRISNNTRIENEHVRFLNHRKYKRLIRDLNLSELILYIITSETRKAKRIELSIICYVLTIVRIDKIVLRF